MMQILRAIEVDVKKGMDLGIFHTSGAKDVLKASVNEYCARIDGAWCDRQNLLFQAQCKDLLSKAKDHKHWWSVGLQPCHNTLDNRRQRFEICHQLADVLSPCAACDACPVLFLVRKELDALHEHLESHEGWRRDDALWMDTTLFAHIFTPDMIESEKLRFKHSEAALSETLA